MHNGNWPVLDDQLANLVQPDTILPAQFFLEKSISDLDCPGERRLMAAVLEDAIRVYRQDAGARNRRRQRLFRETEQWIESTDRSWPFAFERICEILGLDPDYLRRGLREWKGRAQQGLRALVIPIRRDGDEAVVERRAS